MFHKRQITCELLKVSPKQKVVGEVSNGGYELRLRAYLNADDLSELEIDPEHCIANAAKIVLRKGLGEHMVTITPHDGQGGAWHIHNPRVCIDKCAVSPEHPRAKKDSGARKGRKGKGRQELPETPEPQQQELAGMPAADLKKIPIRMEFSLLLPVLGWESKTHKGLFDCLQHSVDLEVYDLSKLDATVTAWLEADNINLLMTYGSDHQPQGAVQSSHEQIVGAVVLAKRPDESLRECYERLLEEGFIGKSTKAA